MKRFFLKNRILILLAVFTISFVGIFSDVKVVDAQAECNVTDAKFRTGANAPYPADDFTHPTNRTIVYVDIQTTGCVGNTIEVSISSYTEPFNASLYAAIVSGGIINTEALIPGWHDLYNADNVPVTVTAGLEQFSLEFISTEEGCYSLVNHWDCQYRIETWDSSGSSTWETEYTNGTQPIANMRLLYDCYGTTNCYTSGLFQQPWGRVNSSNGSVLISTYGIFNPLDNYNTTPNTLIPTEGEDYYLAPLPGFPAACSTPPCSGLGEFLRGLFTVLIVIAGILAFLMIVIGAITHATTDSFSGSEHGRDMIWNAVMGLVLALGAWIILNAINPNLASNLSIAIPKVSLDAPDEDWDNGNAISGAHIAKKHNVNGQPIVMGMAWPSDAAQRGALTAANIQVNHNNCPTAGANNCTSVFFNADNNVIDRIIALRTACAGCVLVVTGGSEAWLHSSHGPEAKNIDLRNEATLNSYLTGLPGGPQQSDDFPTCKTITVSGLGKFWAEAPACSSSGTVPHWHVTFY
jgi:hypothetical protein